MDPNRPNNSQPNNPGNGNPQSVNHDSATQNPPASQTPPIPPGQTPPTHPSEPPPPHTPVSEASPANPIPNPPLQPSSSGNRGGVLIVGGVLFVFIAIVVALYFLIIQQSATPESQVVPQVPIPTYSPTPEATSSALTEEEQEVLDLPIEENIENDFIELEQAINQL